MNARDADRTHSRSLAWLKGAALVAAGGVALTWLCCFLPLGLVASVGAAAALLGWQLEAYRPYMFGLALLLLGASFYLSYRSNRTCHDQQRCVDRRTFRRERITLWVVAVLVLALLSLPYWLGWWVFRY